MQERSRSIHHGRGRRTRTGRGVLLSLALAAVVLLTSGCLHHIRRHEEGTCDVPGSCGVCTRTYHYIAYKPPDYDAPEKADYKWPLFLYLPGTLSIGKDIHRLAQDDPPAEIEMGRDFPMVVVTPMTPTWLERWTPHLVISLIDHMLERYRCDPDRVYLSGVSISAWGVWDTIIAHPDRIAAAVPVCGWGSPKGIERAVDVPVWAFHGGIDFTIPVPFHYRLVEGMRKAGGNPRWTVIPLGFHWIWKPVYKMPELYEWMLQQDLKHRGAPAATPPNTRTPHMPPPPAPRPRAETPRRVSGSALPPPRVIQLTSPVSASTPSAPSR